nr:40S ribosomal protein S5-like [Ipomoea batatas]
MWFVTLLGLELIGAWGDEISGYIQRVEVIKEPAHQSTWDPKEFVRGLWRIRAPVEVVSRRSRRYKYSLAGYTAGAAGRGTVRESISDGEAKMEGAVEVHSANPVAVHSVNPQEEKVRSDILLFNRWSYDDVQVNDLSVDDYITATAAKHPTYTPHTAGRYQAKRFRKAQCPVVERLVNSLMMHGRNNGKKLMAVRIVKHAMEIIHLLTDQNPIQVIVDAVINSGPREDATRIGSAGVVRRQAVDISPLRRVNQAIYLITSGARQSAFRNIKTIAECLADELINAAKGSSNSYAIKKKDEIERVAKANR